MHLSSDASVHRIAQRLGCIAIQLRSSRYHATDITLYSVGLPPRPVRRARLAATEDQTMQ